MQMIRNAARVAAAVAAVALSAASAQAQFNFTGTTRGCFFNSASATSCTPTSGTVSMGSLTFIGSTFDAPAIDGVASFNTADDNFGNFTLGSSMNMNFSNVGFLLELMVTNPASAMGQPTARLSGSVRTDGASSVYVDFANNDFFALSPASSTVRARITDVAVQTAGNNFVNGQLAAAVVPEPSTYALMGTGLAGLLAAARRRRQAA